MYIYLYICIYIYMYTERERGRQRERGRERERERERKREIHIYTYIHIHIHIYIGLYVYIYLYLDTHVYIYTCIHICMYIHIHFFSALTWSRACACSLSTSDCFQFFSFFSRTCHTAASWDFKEAPSTQLLNYKYDWHECVCLRYARVHANLVLQVLLCVCTRAATHCDTLQHTATHCNTLQHTATHCNTLQDTATQVQLPNPRRTRCFSLLLLSVSLSSFSLPLSASLPLVSPHLPRLRSFYLVFSFSLSPLSPSPYAHIYTTHTHNTEDRVKGSRRKMPLCCSVLQFVVVVCFSSVLQCVALCCSVLQCVAVCCSVLQCVAACCHVS